MSGRGQVLGTYSKEFNWTYLKVLCFPGHLAHSAGMFVAPFSPLSLFVQTGECGKRHHGSSPQ